MVIFTVITTSIFPFLHFWRAFPGVQYKFLGRLAHKHRGMYKQNEMSLFCGRSDTGLMAPSFQCAPGLLPIPTGLGGKKETALFHNPLGWKWIK